MNVWQVFSTQRTQSSQSLFFVLFVFSVFFVLNETTVRKVFNCHTDLFAANAAHGS